MTNEPPKHRRLLQFQLRTLLIAVVVLSLPFSWFAVRMQRARKQREAVEAIEKMGGWVTYEPIGPSVPQWMRGLFGDDCFIDVVKAFPSRFSGDEEAMYLNGLTNLELLWLADTQVTDAGLAYLEAMCDLEWLDLTDTQVTGVGLEHLKGLTNLKTLFLAETQVSDAGLEHLKGLTKLKILDISGTNFTPEGVKKLQEALPNCKIEY